MDTIPRTSGIYQILCVPTGKVYVGSAIDLRNRFNDHWSYLRGNKHHNAYLQHAWNKYGEDAFQFVIIEFVLASFILEREQYWLDRTRAFDHKKGFNISPTAGSPLGIKWSDEARARLSQRQIGRVQSQETKEKRAAKLRGRKRPSEVVEKVRRANTGKLPSDAARANMSAAQFRRVDTTREYAITDPNGNEFIIRNLSAFCREHGMIREAMQNVVKGKRSHHRGWKCSRLK